MNHIKNKNPIYLFTARSFVILDFQLFNPTAKLACIIESA